METCLSLLSVPSLERKGPLTKLLLGVGGVLLKLHHLLIVIIIAVFEPYFLLRVFRLFLDSSGKLHEYSMFVPILQVRNCDKSSEFMKPGFPRANGAHGQRSATQSSGDAWPTPTVGWAHQTIRCAPDSVRCANRSRGPTVGCARYERKSCTGHKH